MSLKSKRKLAHMTQEDLAKKTGISVRVIQSYECGARDIRNAGLLNCIKIADALKCDVRDLLPLFVFKDIK